jgi:transcriptional regulator GlxA family with amidase domain
MQLDENLYVRSPHEKVAAKATDIVRVGIVALNGSNALDFMGPIDTFGQANKAPDASLRYKVDLIGVRAGPIVTSSGVRMLPDRIIGSDLDKYDTILVAGGQDIQKPTQDRVLLDWLVASSGTARRIGSVCNGAFALAAAGLLDGRRVAMRGGYAKQLTAMFPRVRAESDRLFVRDGSFYSAAGGAAGIDLCLYLIENDCGSTVPLDVARTLLIYLRRHGGQAQVSEFLKAQSIQNTRISDVVDWALENLSSDLSVDELAKRAAMSSRNFRRAFMGELVTTPARFVESLRVEAARILLETSALSIQQIAYRVGFINSGNMRRAFLRVLKTSPADYRDSQNADAADRNIASFAN